jgi:hypothetical protein
LKDPGARADPPNSFIHIHLEDLTSRFDTGLWEDLDESSQYLKALARGLNSVIQKLLEDEFENVVERLGSGILLSYTQMLMCTLFRNGKHIPGNKCSRIGAHRVKNYVL